MLLGENDQIVTDKLDRKLSREMYIFKFSIVSKYVIFSSVHGTPYDVIRHSAKTLVDLTLLIENSGYHKQEYNGGKPCSN